MERAGFINVYGNDGKAVILAAEVTCSQVQRVLVRAFYDFGLSSPDFTVFQTAEIANRHAEK